MNIHQVMAGYADGDAISSLAVTLRRVFRQWGHTSEIFADPASVSPTLRGDCRPLADYAGTPGDVCLHHYGIMSPATDVFLASPARRIMIYHNITPAAWYDGFDDAVAARLREARGALPRIADASDAVWTVSRFNAAELEADGCRGVQVFPLAYAPVPVDDQPFTRTFPGNLKNILFVGRIAPNKRIEDLIQAFAWYHLGINPFSRLIIVGSPWSCPRYYTMLRLLIGDLGLENVCFEGFASPAGLQAYYRLADLFVCTSAHEGYCLPLVEAMDQGVPVIARAEGGTPEAMDGAGVLYEDLSAAELGVLFDRVLTDEPLRQEILASQRQRIQRAHSRDIEAELRRLLAGLL